MPSEAASHFTAFSEDRTAFHNYVQAERGLAANTVLAYGRDLDRFGVRATGHVRREITCLSRVVRPAG